VRLLELLRIVDRAKRGDGNSQTMLGRSTLTDLGVTRDQSSRWQKLADVAQEQFEAALAGPIQKPSTSGIINSVDPVRAKVAAASSARAISRTYSKRRRCGMIPLAEAAQRSRSGNSS
jgi:hypothetical protein